MFLILASTLALSAPLPVGRLDAFGESCSGAETVQRGATPPVTVPYALIFSVDLGAGTFCYDECGADQTYPISRIGPDQIKLADVNHGGQVRQTTFDRRTATLTDHQIFESGLGRVERNASATCRTSAFHPPSKIQQSSRP